MKDTYIRGYLNGVKEGKRDALLEVQSSNKNSDLPSNKTLKKIFKLLFECMENDGTSVYMNQYDHYADYITLNW